MLIEENQDANLVPDSSAETTDIQTQTTPESQEAGSSPDQSAQTPSSTQPDANQGAAPNGGLPPKENLYGEFRRKIFEEITPIIQGAVRESMLGAQTQQSGQPQVTEVKYQGKYSAQDLDAILRHPDASEHDKLFANRGLAYIEAKQDTLKEIESREEKRVGQSRQEQALQGIVQDYPQVFDRATNRWNFADPLWQRAMQIYNSNDRLKAFGNEGLRVAVDSAFAQMAREGQVAIQKTKVKLTSQQRAIDKNQSQALNSGTLTPAKQDTGATNSHAKIMDAWKKNPGDETLKNAAISKLVPKSWYT